jgi:hypothetical protein
MGELGRRGAVEISDHRHRRLLRTRRERPSCRAAEKRDEFASPHIRSQAQETQHCIGSNEYFARGRNWHQDHCRSAQPMSQMGQDLTHALQQKNHPSSRIHTHQ